MSSSIRRGFTMLEMVIVIVILAIVTGLAVTRFGRTTQRSRQVEAEANLQDIRNAQIRYFQDQGTYTTDTSALVPLLEAWPAGWYRYCMQSADAADFEAVATPNSGTNPSIGIGENGLIDETPSAACP